MIQLCLKKAFQKSTLFAAAIGLSLAAHAGHAQVETIDPNDAIDADLETPDFDGTLESGKATVNDAKDRVADAEIKTPGSNDAVDSVKSAADSVDALPQGDEQQVANVDDVTTYEDDDLIGAAEGVFGKGAKGLAGLIEGILKKQGRPNAYIAGREASGAFVVGLRYGRGKLFHKIEGERDVYWTGPSIGFDVGGNAAKSFVLVYNLYDTEEIYHRFPAGEGAAYFVGGFHVSYLRRGDKVLIPVRLGAGLRLGANVGYMKFSKKQKWLPF